MPKSGKHPAHWTFGSLRPDGYRKVAIDRKNYLIARLICETFHGLAPADSPFCDHIDRNRDRNVPENLRWCSSKEQSRNRQIVEDCIERYGVRHCEDPRAYQQAYYAKNPEYAERQRASKRERRARQKAQGKRDRKCPDGKRHWLTDEEFDARFGINRQLPLF